MRLNCKQARYLEAIPLEISSRRCFLRYASYASASVILPFWSSLSQSAEALNTLKPLSMPSPNAPIENMAGERVLLSDYAPMPLLVNFWASWCPPCVHELPALGVLDKALRERGMAVLLVNIDGKGRDFAADFLSDLGVDIALSMLDSERQLMRTLSVRVMPSSFFIGGDSEIRGVFEGVYEWDVAVNEVARILS